MEFSYNEILEAFLGALDEAGIPPAPGENIVLDGRAHYYKIAGHKGNTKKGYYKVYTDGLPAGSFKSFRNSDGVDITYWAMPTEGRTYTREESKKHAEEAERRREEKDRLAQVVREKAIGEARLMWQASTELESNQKHGYYHEYFRQKKLPGTYGARLFGRDVIIPLTDGREVMTVQTISPSFKSFVKDAPKQGNFYLIPGLSPADGRLALPEGAAEPSGGGETDFGTEDDETAISPQFKNRECVWLCEGFATGASLYEMSGWPTVCAMDAGNLLPVCKRVRELHPEWTVVIAADWDNRHGNTGVAKALEVRKECGLAMVYPVFRNDEDGSDWNDLYMARGPEEAKAALVEALKLAFADPALPLRERSKLFVHVNDSTGRPRGTIENLECLLRYLGVSARYNEIRKEVEYDVPGREYGVDNAMNAAAAWITSRCVEFGMPKTDVDAYLTEIAARNPFNPVLEWIDSAPWDGLPRIDGLVETLETPVEFPDDFKSTLVTKWLVSAVAAAGTRKGFANRGVLVLQGSQAQGKTSWFRRLVPRDSGWFAEGRILDPADKDLLKIVVSHWIVELGELEATFKKADLARLKAFITQDRDLVRLPWARKMSEFPRRTVLGASVNQKEVLIDSTGNSRWWVIPCIKVDYQHEIDMQQVWAEAYVLFKKGMPWWLTREEEARLAEQNVYFEAPDAIEDLIATTFNWEQGTIYPMKMTVTEVLKKCRIDNPTRSQAVKAGEVLRRFSGKDSILTGPSCARRRVFEVPPPV